MSGTDSGVRVLLVGPSLDLLGGQSVQLERLRAGLAGSQKVRLGFVPVNPRLTGVLARLQRIRYARTIVTEAAYLLLLLRALRRYDVVHVYSASYWSFLLAPAPAIVLARLFRKRVILNYHSGEARDHLARWGWHALPIIRRASRVVVQSEYLHEVFAERGVQAMVIPNSLDVDSFPFRERVPLRPRFLTNRNHEAHYGVATVLRAFAAIQAAVPEASLAVAGTGSLTGSLKALAAELGLRRVEFLGKVAVEDMRGLYDSADVFLNGSEIDSMPLSILEAFACGLPVVSTAAGGIPALIEDGRTGLLVVAGDSSALAKAALRLLRDPALVSEITRNARSKCLEEFSEGRVGSAWEEIYTTLGRSE